MINNFPCGFCSDVVGDNDDSVQCDLCNKWNPVLILALKNTKNLKKIRNPDTIQTVQWIYLSRHYLIKTYNLSFWEALLKLYLNHF